MFLQVNVEIDKKNEYYSIRFLHGFDKQGKESNIVVLSYSLHFTFFLLAGMLPCAACLSTTNFAATQREIGSMTD